MRFRACLLNKMIKTAMRMRETGLDYQGKKNRNIYYCQFVFPRHNTLRRLWHRLGEAITRVPGSPALHARGL